MRFRVSAEQAQLRDAVRAFAERTLTREFVRGLDEKAADDSAAPAHRDLLQKMAALGLTALPVPPEHGGLGTGAIDAMLAMEELGRASLAAAVILDSAIGVGCELVKRLASDSQKAAVFAPLLRGELSFAIADDFANMRVRVDGDHFVIDGAGVLVSAARAAQRLVVAASTGETVSLFLLDPHHAGIDYRALPTIGLRAAGGLDELTFRSVRVPRDALLGPLGAGRDALDAALDRTRLHQAAYCIGCAQAVVDAAVRYATEREQFGQPIGKFQAISHLLVDRQVDVDAARVLLYRAAWTTERAATVAREIATPEIATPEIAMPEIAMREIAMANLACTEALLAASSDAMRVHGGYGLTMEFDIQRHFRDARHVVVEAGSSVDNRARIARSMGLAGR